MNLIHIEIATATAGSKEFKQIVEINFYFNEELILSYANITKSYIRIDLTNRFILLDDAKQFRFSNERKGRKDNYICMFVSKKVFMRLLMFCAVEWKYDASLSEVDEMEIIAELFKTLYK